jgi:hypothetical protein
MYLYLLAKPPVSFSMAYPNCGREHVQPLVGGKCFATVDIDLSFIIEEIIP